MLKKAVPNLKRWVSGYLVAVMTLMLVFNNSFAFSALAAETASGSNAEKEASASDAFKNSKVSLKNSQKEDVQFLIFSEQSSYEPGETVCLDLYIKNNTDKTITDGLLKIARAKGIEKDSAYFEDMTDLYEAANREEEKPEETTAEETEEGTSAEEKEELTAESSEEIGLESAETPEITEASENVEDLLPTESEPAVSEEENLGTEVADTEAAEIKDTAAPEPTAETIEREAEETIEEGSVAVEDEESSASAEDEISEDDEEEKEEEEDPERLSELEILPGKTAYINFYYTIDPEIEGMKDQKVDFSFAYTLEDEEGKQTKNTLRETFRYAVDALNLMTVTAGGEKGYVETGKEDEMLLEFDLGLMREVLEEAIEEELEKTENGDASAAEAKRASASELLVGWEDENGERPLGKKDPAVIKNLKCEVETFGVKLDKFKAIPVKDDDNFGTSLKCSFYVSRKTLPGTYYGRVNASYKIKGKSFHTTQGFKVVVKQETGEMELVGKIGDSEIIMTGPVSSFPKADELSLKVSEITQEQQEKVDEALQKKAEEEGSEISQYKALDIKLMADGVETEPEGDVQVRFKNVNLEKVDEKNEAEQEKAEEQSIVKKAVRKVMSLFSAGSEEDVAAVAETGTEGEEESKAKDAENVKAEGSEEAAGETGETAENSENIKVLHLDEDAIVANEMKSEVQENGDVVMDTDHFSIYVVVDMGRPGGYINVTVEHWAAIETITTNAENESIDDATNPAWIIQDDAKYRIESSNGRKIAIKDPTGKYSFGPYLKDNIYNRYIQKINLNNVELEPKIEIYSPSEEPIKIQNEKQIDKIENLSKISTNIDGTVKNANDKGYKIAEIWITNDEQNIGEQNWTGEYVKYKVSAYDEDNNANGIIGKSYKLNEDGSGYIETEVEADTIVVGNGNEKASAITLKQDSIIRFVYEEISHNQEEEIAYFPVTFYDHNLTDGGADEAANQGLNRQEFFKSSTNTSLANKPKIGVGQTSSGNTSDWAENYNWKSGALTEELRKIEEKTEQKQELKNTDLENVDAANLNKGNYLNNDKLAISIPGIVKDNLDSNNNLQFSNGIDYTKFFEQATYKKGGKTYFANKEYKNYELGFKRKGDTYTITSVKKPDGGFALTGLEEIPFTMSNWTKTTALFSNSFWPLDDVTKYYGMDEMRAGKSDVTGLEGDDQTHNWHFGMVFEFDFTVDDYKGPMNFYFRGDDDFWMFVDGQKVIDIGGIHNAAGKAIDMRSWLESQGPVEGTHHVKIYFMERGGFGSCCYMQFTLPNCETVSFPGVDTTNIAVEKRWEEPTDSLRTDKITIQLYRKKVNGQGEPVKDPSKPSDYYDEDGFGLIDDEDVEPEQDLGGLGNVWRCSWRNLPKVDPNNPEYRYIYKVKEKEVKGYITSYEYTSNGEVIPDDNIGSTDDVTCIITNILSPKLTVEVEKKWKDQYIENENNNYPEVLLQLQYKKEGDTKFFNFPGESGVLTLDGTEETNKNENGEEIKSAWEYAPWHGRFKNLPSYADKTDENGNIVKDENGNPIRVPIVAYRVREYTQDANGEFILLEDDNGRFSEDYTVTYEDKQYKLSQDTEASSNDETLTATTEITNTATTDRYVMKNWEGIPSGITPTAKIGLFANKGSINIPRWVLVEDYVKTFDNGKITDENNCIIWAQQNEFTNKEGVSAEKQPFILNLTYNPDLSKSCEGGWKYLPRYDEKGDEIIYRIFEVNDSNEPIVVPENGNGSITTIDGYKYLVTEGMKDNNGTVTNGSGTGASKEEIFIITNHCMSDLIVTKRVENKETGDKKFEFTATITKDNTAFILPQPNENAGYTVNPQTGVIQFKLEANGSVTIPAPVGYTVTIEETKDSQAGYYVSYKVNNLDFDGGKISFIIDGNTSSVDVVCINKPGAVLPDTGGPGLLMMSRLGWMLLLLALLMAGMEIQFYGERRNRRAAAVQREDTRGFDPDDY